jgi:hypothetical protein
MLVFGLKTVRIFYVHVGLCIGIGVLNIYALLFLKMVKERNSRI